MKNRPKKIQVNRDTETILKTFAIGFCVSSVGIAIAILLLILSKK